MPNITHNNSYFLDEVPPSLPFRYLSNEEIANYIKEGFTIIFILEPNPKRNIIPIRERGLEKKGKFLCVVCVGE